MTQSSSSAAASADNDQNDAASSTAADSQTAASSAVESTNAVSESTSILVAEKSSVVSAKLATANRIARVAMVNATAESTELAVQTTDYQALTKDWNVDTKGNVTYTGKSTNLTTITIPNNYDFYQAGKTKANQKLTIETAEAAMEVFKRATKQAGTFAPIIHTDRGAAYTSNDFNNYLTSHNSRHSLSAPGTPADNAVIEHYWGDFKYIWMAHHSHPQTLTELKDLVKQGVEYFNTVEISSKRNNLTAEDFRNEAV